MVTIINRYLSIKNLFTNYPKIVWKNTLKVVEVFFSYNRKIKKKTDNKILLQKFNIHYKVLRYRNVILFIDDLYFDNKIVLQKFNIHFKVLRHRNEFLFIDDISFYKKLI